MFQRLTAILFVLVSLGLQSCGGLKYMREPVEGEARLTSAPAGKALVNFHRPSNYGGGQDYEVFDRTELIGNTQGQTLFQYVCDPGQHVFMGVADRASAIEANLVEGGVYDVVINITMGWMKANITMEAMGDGHPKRPELSAWEEREVLWIFADDEAARSRSERREAWATETMADFMGGSHADRLQQLDPQDAR